MESSRSSSLAQALAYASFMTDVGLLLRAADVHWMREFRAIGNLLESGLADNDRTTWRLLHVRIDIDR
ncbi:MAG: hypothetical protein ACXWNZ_00680 [Vulcanimicrobiaceae bacterium]